MYKLAYNRKIVIKMLLKKWFLHNHYSHDYITKFLSWDEKNIFAVGKIYITRFLGLFCVPAKPRKLEDKVLGLQESLWMNESLNESWKMALKCKYITLFFLRTSKIGP